MSSQETGQQPPDQNAAHTTGKPFLKLRDGALSVSAFRKSRPKGEAYVFISHERAFKDKQDEWVNVSMLHPSDLLPMAFLLMQAHARLNTKNDAPKRE